MSKRFVVTFRTDDQGRVFADRPGFNRYRVFPDRSNKEQPTSTNYLVELGNDFPTKRYCFVRLIESIPRLWNEIVPALLAAQWQSGQDVFSDPWTEIQSPKWGLIKVKFCDTKSRLGTHRFAYVTMADSDSDKQLSFEVGEEVALLGALAEVVRRQVGPRANLAAVISRQADSRAGRQNWRR